MFGYKVQPSMPMSPTTEQMQFCLIVNELEFGVLQLIYKYYGPYYKNRE